MTPVKKGNFGIAAIFQLGYLPRLFAISAFIVALVAAAVVLPRLLFPVNVSERFVQYLEGLKPAGKLVVLTGTDRYTASKEFTTRLLVLLRIDAKVEISAIADMAWYVDLRNPALWSVSWNPRTKDLRLIAPAPAVMPPAVKTETIEVRTLGGNLLSNTVFRLKREAEAMRDELSYELERRAVAGLGDAGLRERMKSSLAELARSFCGAILGLEPVTVEVGFRDQEEGVNPFWGRSNPPR